MHDETDQRTRQDRDAAQHAECFARLVLAGRQDHNGRNLLDHAERAAGRLATLSEKTIAWLAAALHGDGVDETTLTGIGFDYQDVRHATVVRPDEDESAIAYSERLAAYNQPEGFAVGEAFLDEAADTNPAVPAGTSDMARNEAIGRLRNAHEQCTSQRKGEQPPAGGMVDDRPTGPGLADGLHRLVHHTRMINLCLKEMLQGPGNMPWGFGERLSYDDLENFLNAGYDLLSSAAAVIVETSNTTPAPATVKQQARILTARQAGVGTLDAIAILGATIHEVATRVKSSVPMLPDSNDTRTH